MPLVLAFLLLPVPVALLAAGMALDGHRSLPRLHMALRLPLRSRRRPALPGGTRRDFFGDRVGADVTAPLPAPRARVQTPAPAVPESRPAAPAPAPVAREEAPVSGASRAA